MKITILVLFSLLALPKAQAQEVELSVTPNKCVALRKGQTCYQRLRITFTAPVKSNYCLLIADQSSPLKCWDDVATAEFRYQLAAKSTVDFLLVDAGKSTLATSRVNVAWVYKRARTRNRWRLF